MKQMELKKYSLCDDWTNRVDIIFLISVRYSIFYGRNEKNKSLKWGKIYYLWYTLSLNKLLMKMEERKKPDENSFKRIKRNEQFSNNSRSFFFDENITRKVNQKNYLLTGTISSESTLFITDIPTEFRSLDGILHKLQKSVLQNIYSICMIIYKNAKEEEEEDKEPKGDNVFS